MSKYSRKLKILLIYPIVGVSQYPPLGIGYLAAIAEQNDCQVKIIVRRTPYEDYSNEDICNQAKVFSPDVIGLTVFDEFSLRDIYDLMRKLSTLKASIVAGGPHATLYPHEVLENFADIVVREQGEGTFSDLIEYFKGNMDFKQILGISYKDDSGRIIDNMPRSTIKDLDSLPFPAKHLFNREDYIRSTVEKEQGRPFGNIITARGCPASCTYCSKNVFGRKFRFRTAESIFAEIMYLKKNYNTINFIIVDDSFTANKKRVNSLCDMLIERADPNLRWNCQTRPDFVTQQLLFKMKKAGCDFMIYGLESGDSETLKKIKKGFTVEDARKAVKWTYNAGIRCWANFMFGFPWEKAENLDKTFQFIKELSPMVEIFSWGGILIPHGGTQIYKEYKEMYGFEQWWLKENYATDYNTKLYNTMGFYCDGVLENNFFPYSAEIKKKIRTIQRFIAHHNLASQPFISRQIRLLFANVSQVASKLNPQLDKQIAAPIYYFLENGYRLHLRTYLQRYLEGVKKRR